MKGFKRVSRDRYYEMLEALWPACWLSPGFLLGEAQRHNAQGQPMYTAFLETKSGDRATYWQSLEPMTVPDFRQFCQGLR